MAAIGWSCFQRAVRCRTCSCTSAHAKGVLGAAFGDDKYMYGANRENEKQEHASALSGCKQRISNGDLARWRGGDRDYRQTIVGKNWRHGCVPTVICIEEDPRRIAVVGDMPTAEYQPGSGGRRIGVKVGG